MSTETAPLTLRQALDQLATVVQQHYESKWYGFEWAAIALAMCMGIVGGVYLVYYVAYRILFRDQYQRRYMRAGKDPSDPTGYHWEPEQKSATRPYIRVALNVFLIIGIIWGIWAAFTIAGYNYVNSPFNQLIITGLSAYMFSSALTNFGAGFWNNLESKFSENNYLSLPQFGPMCRGVLKEKHSQFVELHHINQDGFMVDVMIPNTVMANSVVFREHQYEFPPEGTKDRNGKDIGVKGGKLELYFKSEAAYQHYLQEKHNAGVRHHVDGGDVVFHITPVREMRKVK